MTWPNKTIADIEYDLSHLDALVIAITPKAANAPTYRVRVTFGLHTFTREALPDDSLDFHVSDGRENRCFCPTRFECSKLLPAIIQKANRAHFSQRDNFLLVRNLDGFNAPYAIFFDITKAKQQDADVAMFITSAYLKPNLPPNLPTITLATIVSQTAQGLPIVRPKRKR